MGVIRGKIGEGLGDIDPNELVLTFGGLHVCVQFGENRRRIATVRVSTDRHTQGEVKIKKLRHFQFVYSFCNLYDCTSYRQKKAAVRHLGFATCMLKTAYERHLIVFSTVQNLVGIGVGGVVSKICDCKFK